nr:11667_t:CDS:2 [Entrophospora candida]
MNTLPSEFLTEIFERLYLEGDKPTLFSCCLVNRRWSNCCIKILWREPFESKGSIKILINCLILYSELDTLLREDDVQLDLELLGADQTKPLYNYAVFAKRLAIFEGHFQGLVNENTNLLIKNLVNLILKSAKIQEIYLGDLIPYLPNNFHENPELRFENIREFHYVNTDSPGLLNDFVGIANEIEKLTVEIKKNDEVDDGLDRLINSKYKLRIMHLLVDKDCSLSRTTLLALLGKSGSLIEFRGYIHTMDEMLEKGAEFTNMKRLDLFNHYDDENISMTSFKDAEFPQLEEFHFRFNIEGTIGDLIQFISRNGSNLKIIVIEGNPDESLFGLFIEEIAITCQNLKYLYLPTLYHSDYQASLDQLSENQLVGLIDLPNKLFKVLDIIKGKRPEVTEDTPQFYADLMKKCWDPMPENRPDFCEIRECLDKYRHDSGFYREEKEIIKLAEDKRQEIITSEKYLSDEKTYKHHQESFYINRPLKKIIEQANSSTSLGNNLSPSLYLCNYDWEANKLVFINE